MPFAEFTFFLLFAVVFTLVWTLRTNAQRKLVLTAASYALYGAWDWRLLGLILFVTAISHIICIRLIISPTDRQRQKRWLTLGIVAMIGVLGIFKYFNFFADSFTDFAELISLPAGQITLSLVLPVSLGCFIFQAISYMLDAYRGNIAAKRSLQDAAFYIAFFPQLLAGPSIRASGFVAQMQTARRWADVAVRPALILFLIGFVKKVCISDNIAPYVDMVFATPESFTAPAMIGGVFLYGVQIYCDLSGYSDMAIALAALLGYKFPQTFAAPYLSPNIQNFWQRWHISLSSWLHDHLYNPLRSRSDGNMWRNINLATMLLLGGLWLGASFNFAVWTGLHGGALIIGWQWNRHVTSRLPGLGFLGALIGTLMTVYWVNLTWIFFRASTLEQSLGMASTYLTWQSAGTETLPIPLWPMLLALGLVHWLSNRVDANEEFTKLSPNMFAMVFGAMAAVALAFVPLDYQTFN